MNNNIRIVYIDDNPDNSLVKFLRDHYKNDDVNIDFKQITFNEKYSYETLLNDPIIKTSNIIVIDSKLFEENHVEDAKFTGEEFELILRREFSFIEVILISQNKMDIKKVIRKFNNPRSDDGISYYRKVMTNRLEEVITNVLYYRKISEKFKENTNINKMTIEKIINSLDGINSYNDLNKEDIDNVIMLFKEIQSRYE